MNNIIGMFHFIKEVKLAPVLKGTIKRLPGAKSFLPKKTGGTNNARYCYAVWMRHLIYLSKFNHQIPKHILEIGPGDSPGVGLAALICGTQSYTGIDIVKYWNSERNLKLLEDLLELLRSRKPIPGPDEFPNLFPELDDYSFPGKILTDDLLNSTLSEFNIERIRKIVKAPLENKESRICFVLPHEASRVIPINSMDLVFSQAVLGQVDDLSTLYNSMGLWVKPNGYLSHTIDLSCHGYTNNWNGHWTLPDLSWNIVRGGRTFAINRQPLSVHKRFLSENKFYVLFENKKSRENNLKRSDLARRFENLTPEDIVTSGVYYIACKQKA